MNGTLVSAVGDSLAANVKRLSAKVFVRDGSAVDQSEFIPVFHQWIQRGSDQQVLIDVADYRHVHHGPGVMLIAHEGHYAMDEGAGRLGLMFQQTRWDGSDPRDRLRDLLYVTLSACHRLEEDLPDRIQFRTDEILIRVADRLAAPNTEDTYEQWSALVSAVLEPVFDSSAFRVRRDVADDALGIRVFTNEAVEIPRVLARLCPDGNRL